MTSMETSDLKICSIHELIQRIRCSSSESEFDKVREMLIDRENSMKSKLDSLVRELDSLKEKERWLERALISSHLEKCKFEDKCQLSQRECQGLKERIKEVVENLKLMMNKRGDEWSMKACEGGTTVGEDDKENLKLLEIEFVQMFEEMKGLRCEKAAADQTVEELKQRKSQANQIIDELKRQNTEALQTIDELRLKKSMSDKAAELNKKRLENLTPRIIKVEEELAAMLNVNVEDLANLVEDSFNSSGLEETNATGMSPGVHSTCHSTPNDLLKEGVGISVPSSRSEVDGADGFQTSPGAQSGNHPPQVEANDTDTEHESKGLRVSGPGPSLPPGGLDYGDMDTSI